MKEAQGDLDGAIDLLDDAERVNTGGLAQTCVPTGRGGRGCG